MEENTKPQNPTLAAYLGIKDTSDINKQKAYTQMECRTVYCYPQSRSSQNEATT